ncbi:MAG: hypothetical protein FJ211_05360 [Ignavibacteria bacterium]|nr:hypothetical protein [Ignavibacteria bacterium]
MLRQVTLCIVVLSAISSIVLLHAQRSEDRGEVLAKQYCQSCHVQPLPEHLDKSTWISKVFPVMRTYMGLDLPAGRDQMSHDLAAMYPTVPMMTEDEWFAIASWYIEKAPAKLPTPPALQYRGTSPMFQSLRMPAEQPAPMTSVVQFDTIHRCIVVGDAQTHMLRVLDLNGREIRRIDVGGPPSCLVIKGNTWYVTNMGKLLPHDSAVGSVAQIAWSGSPIAGASTYKMSTLIDTLRRPTSLVVDDINQDGRLDFLVTEYGNLLGRFGWFESLKSGAFTYHELAAQPGAIRAIVKDVTNDKRPDIIVVMAQAREVVRIYENNGKGRFSSHDVIESPPSFGSSSVSLADVDGDRVDEILLTTGDNGDYQSPPYKPYHGVYVYKRSKPLVYALATFDPFDGAYGAIARDFDRNGKMDLLSFSYFPNLHGQDIDLVRISHDNIKNDQGVWSVGDAQSGRWLVSDAADVDGDGDVDVILGNVSIGPGAVTDKQAEIWMSSGYSALFLRNTNR